MNEVLQSWKDYNKKESLIQCFFISIDCLKNTTKAVFIKRNNLNKIVHSSGIQQWCSRDHKPPDRNRDQNPKIFSKPRSTLRLASFEISGSRPKSEKIETKTET